jgi:hypothetical protein
LWPSSRYFSSSDLPDSPARLIGGFAAVLLGLASSSRDSTPRSFPAGETMAFDYARRGSFLWLMLFAFCISFASVAAEPALMAVAYKAEAVSGGSMGALTLRMVAALGVGLAVVVGVWRIVRGHSIGNYLIPGYLIVIALTVFSPPQLVGLAFDSGGVVASTVTAPLLTALGVGLATSIRGRNPDARRLWSDRFRCARADDHHPDLRHRLFRAGGSGRHGGSDDADRRPAPVCCPGTIDRLPDHGEKPAADHRRGPVLEFRHPSPPARRSQRPGRRNGPRGCRSLLFDEGLQVGLFPLGDEMTRGLMRDGVAMWAVYLYGFLIGFATTMAEPALIALSIKADEVSLRQLNGIWLRSLVSIGVGIGIMIGCARIIDGTNIAYWLIPGYLLVLAMAKVAPRFIVPIALTAAA